VRAAWTLLAVVALFTSCATPGPLSPNPTPTPSPFRASIAAGQSYALSGQRTAAEAAFREAARLQALDPQPYLLLAQLYHDWHRPQLGLEALVSAEERGAPAAELDPLRAALHSDLGNWTEVLQHGQAALSHSPGDVATRHLVAQAHVARNRASQALIQYQEILEGAPGDPLARERQAVLLAIIDPAQAPAYLRSADGPLAADLVAVLAHSHNNAAHRLAWIGQACLAHGEPALAVLALQRAVTRSPAYADAHTLLGQALDHLSRPVEATGHLETAVRLAPDSALAQSLLGIHHLRQGDAMAARPFLERACQLDPGNAGFAVLLARAYGDMGQYAAAETWLREGTRLAGDDTAIWESVARFYLKHGFADSERGLGAARTLAELAPQSARAADLLGWACFLAGEEAQAEEALLRAIDMDPNLASAHYHLGQFYAYRGQYEEARAALGRALDQRVEPAMRDEIEAALSQLEGPPPE